MVMYSSLVLKCLVHLVLRWRQNPTDMVICVFDCIPHFYLRWRQNQRHRKVTKPEIKGCQHSSLSLASFSLMPVMVMWIFVSIPHSFLASLQHLFCRLEPLYAKLQSLSSTLQLLKNYLIAAMSLTKMVRLVLRWRQNPTDVIIVKNKMAANIQWAAWKIVLVPELCILFADQIISTVSDKDGPSDTVMKTTYLLAFPTLFSSRCFG